MSDIEQLSFPLRIVDGTLATVDASSDQYILEQAWVLCLTPLKWVPGAPEMGLADERFRKGGADTGAIESQIRRWVPGVDAAVSRDPLLLNHALDSLGVRVTR